MWSAVLVWANSIVYTWCIKEHITIFQKKKKIHFNYTLKGKYGNDQYSGRIGYCQMELAQSLYNPVMAQLVMKISIKKV